jgi:hypothetical protein
MSDTERHYDVVRLLREYVSSPSLQHIRDHSALCRVASEIIKRVDGANSLWKKWSTLREALLKPAITCWIPRADLQEELNRLPGPHLTQTDVLQKMKAFQDEDYYNYPNDELQTGCLELYEREKLAGTELIAIIFAIREYAENEEARLSKERHEAYKRQAQAEQLAKEQTFLSGAECKWTQIGEAPDLYCRINGRAYRLTPTQDKMWQAFRIASVDDQAVRFIGKYKRRGDASKAIQEVAYKPDI